jgi:cytidine deaminase
MNIDPLRLLKAAAEASGKAYSPYSSFAVGSAVLTADGAVFTGCNVENASFGLTNCAERTALFSAVTAGKKDFVAMAVVAEEKDMPYPCGACRQVMVEFCRPDLPVFVASRTDLTAFEQMNLGDLLPKRFKLKK